MQTHGTPAELVYGWVRDLQFLPDFGRFEAAVILRIDDPQEGARDIEIITSVDAHQDEDPAALRERLVFDAARLMRLSEIGVPVSADVPLAA